ncbi:MAG TPA: DUF1732 domain-containing protein, partial [Gemmatimonadales bacterium]|nr:DUF1732 domain-containing protein [Gemmatimonadales bacterium]
MTGFGAAEGAVGGGRVRIEIRTVNHRHFNPSLKLPNEFVALEAEIRERLRREFDRGHVAVSVRWDEVPEARVGSLQVNLERARAAVAAIRELQQQLNLPGEIDLGMVLRQPEVIATTRPDEVPMIPFAEVEPVLLGAVAECKAMRKREGAVLANELLHRLTLLEAAAGIVAQRAPERLLRERDRLRANVTQLMDGRAADEQRLAQEIAFLADKLDITEELVRFAAHIAACRQSLASDAPVGKQLGFLAQELGREV